MFPESLMAFFLPPQSLSRRSHPTHALKIHFYIALTHLPEIPIIYLQLPKKQFHLHGKNHLKPNICKSIICPFKVALFFFSQQQEYRLTILYLTPLS